MSRGPRTIPGQVPAFMSRLLRGGYEKQEPSWFRATLENPPLPPPYNRARKTDAHNEYIRRLQQGLKTDLIEKKLHKNHMYNLPTIRYLADRVRNQFFKDHPWEAARPQVLVEPDEMIAAQYDTRRKGANLRDYGRNPNVEDLIQAVLSLHEEGGMSLLEAYQRQIGAYYALRAEHETATRFANLEAKEMGGHLGRTVVDREFVKERESLRHQEDEYVPVAGIVNQTRFIPDTPKEFKQDQQQSRDQQRGNQFQRDGERAPRPPPTRKVDDQSDAPAFNPFR